MQTDYWKIIMYLAGTALLWATMSCQSDSTDEVSEEFAKNIRTTDAQLPVEQRRGFSLPAGFNIQLFAAEPDIGKPLNMAFDDRGRMWLTQSFEYPFADTTGHPKDQISILEDTDGDGQADKFTVFADSLNIPIGIIAVPDGAVAYSIPHIYHLIDRDGDDRVDERKPLYSGFQYKDTHGMINNLVRSWDGWVHADHGFANTSRVAGSDGDTIVMFSGNTFRFRLDGSRVEFTTTGRVNPYGYAYDELGYTYSTDCHTSPLYQLVRGADYPHFSKKPTGIGFGPALMEHNHGSTALAGLDYYLADQFPESHQLSFYLGDVVRSRVYRATMELQGTTPVVTWQPDFVVSEDPWFRPVDVKLGPDGALYIADFYNRIIGHYEVPLDHPGRDRQRGRIWRITYGNPAPQAPRDWSAEDLPGLIAHLNHDNLPLRMSLADEIVDRFGSRANADILGMMERPDVDYRSYTQGLWILFRTRGLTRELLLEALNHGHEVIRVHARRVLFELENPDANLVAIAVNGLEDSSPHVQRQSVMIAGKHPRQDQVKPLLQLARQVPEADTHLAYSIKQSVRDHVRQAPIMQWVNDSNWDPDEMTLLAAAMLGDSTIGAANFLISYLADVSTSSADDQMNLYVRHIARYGSSDQLDQMIGLLQEAGEDYHEQSIEHFRAVEEGIMLAERPLPARGRTWGLELARYCLDEDLIEGTDWMVAPFPHQPYGTNPWRLVDTAASSGDRATFLASGPLSDDGYDVSTVRSPDFALPEVLNFELLGRKNPPSANQVVSPPANKVQLISTLSSEILQEAEITAPWHSEPIRWRIDPGNQGNDAYLLITDGSRTRGEFVAIAALDPAVTDLPAESPQKVADKLIFAGDIVARYADEVTSYPLAELLRHRASDVHARAAAAGALLSVDRTNAGNLVEEILQDTTETLLLKEEVALILAEGATASDAKLISAIFNDLTYGKQKQVALQLASSPVGLIPLLEDIEGGAISGQFLREPSLQEELALALNTEAQAKLVSVTSLFAPLGEDKEELINDRLKGYRMKRHPAADGAATFSQFCSPCHQIDGQGNLIGPQLDGIGSWGLNALTEKVLDPNRNISKAFVNYTIQLKDGKTMTGLLKSEEGDQLHFADAAGQEFTLHKDDIEVRKVSPYSLMPDHFGRIIPEEQYYSLISYLLNEI